MEITIWNTWVHGSSNWDRGHRTKPAPTSDNAFGSGEWTGTPGPANKQRNRRRHGEKEGRPFFRAYPEDYSPEKE